MKFNILYVFIAIMTFVFSVNIYNITLADPEISELVTSSMFSKIGTVSLYFIILFSILRFRDILIKTPFPIAKINESPLSASLYYSVSMFSFAYALSHILG